MGELKWARRVSREKIKSLYESDAKGIRDDDLIDEVGYALYARADSFIKANRAHEEGIAECPDCGEDTPVTEDGYFACACGWRLSAKDHHATYKGKQLVGCAVVPFAERFISDWEKAKGGYPEKMRAIDYLIHTFHHELTGQTTRPAAVNFIEGRLTTIIDFIFELAYGYGPDAHNEQMERWLANADKSPWLRDGVREKAAAMRRSQQSS
ncbi:MAG: hypothetical protein FWE70_08025 [Oscillospiraceae bacterium]|nr:hypothetical protein [Oscillospiraceae bacterium]